MIAMAIGGLTAFGDVKSDIAKVQTKQQEQDKINSQIVETLDKMEDRVLNSQQSMEVRLSKQQDDMRKDITDIRNYLMRGKSAIN